MVDELTVTLLQLYPSMVTFVAPVMKFVPEIVTDCPPPVVPVVGVILIIEGVSTTYV